MTFRFSDICDAVSVICNTSKMMGDFHTPIDDFGFPDGFGYGGVGPGPGPGGQGPGPGPGPGMPGPLQQPQQMSGWFLVLKFVVFLAILMA